MKFENCTIIIPIIRETELFEQVVGTILETCNPTDLKEFIIVVHPKYTNPDSFAYIEKMRAKCEAAGVKYQVLEQKLPGMGGAMRDALDAATGSHSIIQNADMALDPKQVSTLISRAKETPSDIISVSRHMKGSKIEKGYDKLKLIWNVLAQKYCAVLYQSSVTDYTYAYRICPTAYYHAINWEEVKHPFALESTLKFVRLRIPFHEIPGNQVGGSQSGYGETLMYLPTSLRIRFMTRKNILKSGANKIKQGDEQHDLSVG